MRYANWTATVVIGLCFFSIQRDGTSACTQEVQDFNALVNDFQKLTANIAGVSGDSARTHKNFSEKHGVRYSLLSDKDRAYIDSLGLLIDKKMYGKPVKGVNRSTYLIDPSGIVKSVWNKVKVPGHAAEVLKKLEELKGAK